jgi:predicted secreted protein
MTKRTLIAFLLVCTAYIAFAGDVAAYVDMGFSQDGSTYVFAQYGITDKAYEGYAEIYTIDIEKNDYVDSGVFRTLASNKTVGESGSNIYQTMLEKNLSYFSQMKLKPATLQNTLYIKREAKEAGSEIIFKDFERASDGNLISYSIRLIPWYEGKTTKSKSSFFISLEKKDENGKLLYKKVIGNPEIKRTGVSEYLIDRIICDEGNNNLIFVIQKNMITENGTSVRYMVEAQKIK